MRQREEVQEMLWGDRALSIPVYRVDPRGNKTGVDAQFTPPREQLAFAAQAAGEADLPKIWPEPLPVAVPALRSWHTYDTLAENLPDVPLISQTSA